MQVDGGGGGARASLSRCTYNTDAAAAAAGAGGRLLFAFGVQHLHEKSLSGRTAGAVFLVQVVFAPARHGVHFR
jgi:hypothetical protein